MSVTGKYRLQKILTAMVWIILGSGITVLLVAAISKRKNDHCVGTNINITGVQNNFFIDKSDVIKILQKVNGGELEKKPIGEINLALMENALQKNQFIKQAELFFDNNNTLEVRVSEREPVSRIFTISGRSFYLDSSLKRLPLSDKFSARLPVFTNFPTDLMVLKRQDSNLLRQIKTLGEFIGNDPFWMAQIEQIDINPDRSFVLIPKMGNQVIQFGDADDHILKFRKLLTFYKQVVVKSGWNKYSVIDLKYKDQVIAVRRGVDEMKMDSLKTIQIMKNIVANAQKHSNDSSDIQLVQPPDDNTIINTPQARDDAAGNIDSAGILEESTGRVNETTVTTKKHAAEATPEEKGNSDSMRASLKKTSEKKVIKQKVDSPKKPKRVPKAVMPAKSEY